MQVIVAVMYTIIGITIGCWLMYMTHRDVYQHYYKCQEKDLIDSLCNLRDEKNWYIKEDKTGKIRIVQYSIKQLDSLSAIK